MFGKKLSSTEDGEALNGITCEGCRTGKINDLPGFIVVFFYLYSTNFICILLVFYKFFLWRHALYSQVSEQEVCFLKLLFPKRHQP